MVGDIADALVVDDSKGMFMNIPMPSVWPLKFDTDVIRHADNSASVTFTKFGTIRAQMFSDRLGELLECETPRIVIRGEGNLMTFVAITMNESEDALRIFINATDYNRFGPVVRLRREPEPLRSGFPVPTGPDPDSAERRARRQQQSADLVRNGVLIDRLRDQLVRELRLLRAALNRLAGGETDEVVTVSVHLRKLIGGGKGNGALQKFGGLSDVSLDVWALPPQPEGTWHPRDLPVSLTQLPTVFFAAGETTTYRFAMDIDAWLARDDVAMAGKWMTNLDLLHSIADKIGAHLDLSPAPVVDRLEASQAFGVDFLTRYLIELGTAVCEVADRVLLNASAE